MSNRRVALTGGIATGKSTISKIFAELGVLIIDADQVAREVIEPGAACWRELRDLLGPAYFDPDGRLKRRKLRECIISDSECRSQVNAILHPAIMNAMEEQWRNSVKSDPDRPVIFDIPLLFEVNRARDFDLVILVYAPAETQIRRLMERDHLSREEAEKTLNFQFPIESKKSIADIVIDNSGDLDHTREQVRHVWEEVKR